MPKTVAASSLVYDKDDGGRHLWRLLSRNGREIARSAKTYSTKLGAQKAWDSLLTAMEDVKKKRLKIVG